MRHLSVLLFSLCVSIALAQTGSIEGTVTGPDGLGVPQATVLIDADEGIGTTTDLDGRYTLEVSPGTYFVLYRYIGLQDVVREVEVEAGETVRQDVVMEEQAEELDIVVVTGGKYEKKLGEEVVSLEVVPTSIIENNVAQAQEALNRVPGYQQLGESPSIRGGSSWAAGASSRTLFMIDGVPQLSPENGAVYYELLPLENLRQVEVIKGASSALYGGSALNGIINFRTAWPDKDEPYHRVTQAIGVYQPFSANLIRSKNSDSTRNLDPDWWWDDENHLPVYMNTTYEHRESFEHIDLVLGAHYRHDQSFRKNNETDRFRLNGKLRHMSTGDRGVVAGLGWNMVYQEGGAFFLWSGTDRDALLPSNPADPFDGDVRTDNVQTRISLTPFLDVYDKKDNKHSFQGRYYWNQSTNFGFESVRTNHAFGEYTFQKNDVNGWKVVSGLSGYYTLSRGNTFGGNEYDAANASLFTQFDKKLFGMLTFTGGVRLEYNQVDSIVHRARLPLASLFTDDDVTTPVKPLFRFGMNIEPISGTYIRASWGQGIRVPTINEHFIFLQRGLNVRPNPNLVPETGWSAELGIKQGVQVGPWQGYFDAVGFITQYQDLIDFRLNFTQQDALHVIADNLDDARIAGLELSALGQGDLLGYPLTFLVGYTFMQPILLDPVAAGVDTSRENYQYLNYRNKHSFKADVEVTVKRFSFGITSIFNSFMLTIPVAQGNAPGLVEYRERNPNGEWVFDTRFRYAMSDQAHLTLAVKNLFNNEYTTRPGILEAPRNYAVQLQYEF